MAYYVKVVNPREFRRDILESSQKVVHTLQHYRDLSFLRQSKRELFLKLKEDIKEIGFLLAELDKLLPEKHLRQGEKSLKKEQDFKKKRKETKKAKEEKIAMRKALEKKKKAEKKTPPSPPIKKQKTQPSVQNPEEEPKTDQSVSTTEPADVPIADAEPSENPEEELTASEEGEKLQSTLDDIQRRMEQIK